MQALTGAAPEEGPAPSVGFGGWRGGAAGAGASASPFLAGHGTGNLSLTAGQLPVISEVRLSGGRRSLDKRRSGKGMQSTMLPVVEEGEGGEAGDAPDAGEAADDAASEDSLVDELAEQAKAEAGQQRVVSGARGPLCILLPRTCRRAWHCEPSRVLRLCLQPAYPLPLLLHVPRQLLPLGWVPSLGGGPPASLSHARPGATSNPHPPTHSPPRPPPAQTPHPTV